MAAIGNSPTQQAFTPAIDYFSGNGSTTAFTLSRPVASVAQVQVTIDNVAQNPSSAYTVSANTITFTSAPLSGTNNIYVYYTSPITQVIAPGQNTVYPTSLSTTNALYWDTNANVGIGTTSPDSSNKLQVTGDIGLTWATDKFIGMKFGAGTSYKMGLVLKDSTRECKVWSQSSDSDDKITFYTGSTPSERMRIDSSGNVGIGTSSPAGRLHVSASSDVEIRSATTGANYATFRLKNSTNDYSMQIRTDQSNAWTLRDETAGANRLLIRASDGLLFSPPMYATTSGNSANVVVNPDGGVLRSTSALKYKQDIRDLPSIDITKFRPIVYKSKCEGDDQTKDHFGFIADEVDAAGIKELVQYGAKGEIEGFSYDRLSAVLVKAIQELKAINDTQAETINALTARIVALENR